LAKFEILAKSGTNVEGLCCVGKLCVEKVFVEKKRFALLFELQQ